MRFAPTAPQRLCARTTCRASSGKGLVSRRDAETQRGTGPRTVGFFCVSLRFLRPYVPPLIEASQSHAQARRREGGSGRVSSRCWTSLLVRGEGGIKERTKGADWLTQRRKDAKGEGTEAGCPLIAVLVSLRLERTGREESVQVGVTSRR